MKENNINIYDISKLAGVSIATVSRVMNNNPKVSEKTKARVMQVIEEHGYTPNRFAKSLALNSMKTVGILCSHTSDMFFANALNYITNELRKDDYDTLLYCTGYSIEQKQRYMETLLSKGVDAVILVGSDFIEVEDSNNEYIIKASKIVPIILINGYLVGENIYSITCNDSNLVEDVTKRLIQNGANDIVFASKTLSYGSRKKLSGFKKAYEDLVLTIKPHQFQILNGSFEEVCECFDKLPKIDAIITGDDDLAIAAIKVATQKGIKVPDELQVVGYNNSVLTRYCQPEISSIDNNLERCCFSAIETLMKVLNHEKAPSHILIEGELIKRSSTKDI